MLMQVFAEYIRNCTPANFEPGDMKIAAYMLLGAFRSFFFRPDQLAVYFGEKLESPSQEFRDKAVETMALLVGRFGQMI